MRSGTRQTLATIALIAGSAIFLVAALLGWSGMMTLGLLAAGGGLFGLYGQDRGAPQPADTEAFLQAQLAGRGYAGAFELRAVRHDVFTAPRPARPLVRFGADVTFTEPLYRPADPPAALFEGFTPRRLSWVRKIIAQLVDEGVPGAAELRARMPPDPYQRRHVAVKTSKGARATFTGTASATREGEVWVYTLEESGGTLGATADTGEPLATLGDPLILNHRESERWIRETLVAWRRYEREVQALRQKAELARADHVARAIEEFFDTVKAGTFFHGTGESATGQQTPAHYFLEVVSADAASRAIVLLLRNDGSWAHARRFTGNVGYHEGEHAVEVNAATRAEDAVAQAGPIVGVDGAFALRLHHVPGMPSGLVTYGGDVMIQFQEIARDALEPLRARAFARRQRLADATSPGATYVGRAVHARGERPLALTFVPGADPGSTMARLETAEWSGMFTVRERCNRYDTTGPDLVLEPVVTLGSDRPRTAVEPHAAHDTWARIDLVVEEGQLTGHITCPGPALQVTLRRSASGTGARSATPRAGTPT